MSSLEKLIQEAQVDGVLLNDSDIDDIKNEDSQRLFEIGYIYYKLHTFHKAMIWLTLSAKNGYGEAQRQLGIMHEYGFGVPMNKITALRFYYKGFLQGSFKARNNVQNLENHGFSLEKGALVYLELENQMSENMKRKNTKIKELEKKIDELNESLAVEKDTVRKLTEKIAFLEQKENHSEKDKSIKQEVLNVSKDHGLEQRLSIIETMLSNMFTTNSKKSHD